MGKVAIFTDSAADLPPDRAAGAGITVVPLTLSFGDEEFRAGIDMTTDEFWDRLTAPGAPFPKTAAAAPGPFQEAFERAFEERADSIVYVGVGAKLSATVQSARIARDSLPGRDIHVVDTDTASMGVGLLAELAAEMAAAGAPAAGIAAEVERRKDDVELYVVLDTLEYLKRGGRISAARAAIGEVLSVKPIITVEGGVVEVADRVRTRSKARERLIELLAARPTERIAVLHGRAPGIEEFAREIAGRAGVPDERVTIQPIGASVGPHVGPGAYGAVVLRQAKPA
jgi:DegV family protein with EDD domain